MRERAERWICCFGLLALLGCGDGDARQSLVPADAGSPTPPIWPQAFTGSRAAGGAGPDEGGDDGGAAPAPGVPETLTLVSADAEGAPFRADSTTAPQAVASGGAVVVFATGAALDDADTLAFADVFALEPATGRLERLSAKVDGGPVEAESQPGAVSADGRYVAFTSSADDLVEGDDNGVADVFVRDRTTGLSTLLAAGRAGEPLNGDSATPAISADGRFVAFASRADNLVEGDDNGVADVFVTDRVLGLTTRVSLGPGGVEPSLPSEAPSLSADGRFVAFTSSAPELLTGADGNGAAGDVFLRDRLLETTELVSRREDGTQADGASGGLGEQAVSGDGRVVVFTSRARNLLPGFVGAQVYVLDRRSGRLEAASAHEVTGARGDGDSSGVGVSADGRFVVFTSAATNLGPQDANAAVDVFVRDRDSGRVAVVSRGERGAGPLFGSATSSPAISPDGRFVTFVSTSAGLLPGLPSDGAARVYLVPNPLAQ